MSEPIDPSPAEAPTPADATIPPAPKKKRRLWLKILLGLVVVVVLLVLLLPTIISLAPVRAIVVSQAQGYLNGRLEIDSWSFGWLTGTKIDGVKVYDKDGTLVAEADRVDTGLSLLELIRQDFDLGDTVIDVNATKLVVHKDGRINYLDLVKPGTPKEHAEPSEPKEKKPGQPTKVPNVKGNIELRLRGSAQLIDDATGKTVDVQLRQGSGGTIKIADINQGVAPDLKLIYDVNGKSQSEIAISGNVDAIDNNQLDTSKLLQTLTAKLKLALKDVDLAAAQPFLAMAGQPDTTVSGLANGTIDTDLQPGQPGGAKGELVITQFHFAGPQLADPYSADTIRLPINVTRSTANGNVRDTLDIKAVLPEAQVAIAGDVSEASLENIAAKKAPGDTGWLSVTTTADPAKAAASLPKTLRILPDVKITGGQLVNRIDIAIQPEQLVTKSQTDFALAGVGTTDGQPKQIPPINLVTNANLKLPATPSKMSVFLTSDFAKLTGGGDTLAQLHADGSADLDKLRTELAQFFALGDTKLAGTADIAVRSNSSSDNNVTLDATVNVNKLLLSLPGKPAIDLPFFKVVVNTNATLQDNKPTAISSANATIQAGSDPAKPLLDSAVAAGNIDLNSKKIGNFKVDHFTVTDAAELQRRFVDPFVPALKDQKIVIESGQIYFVAAGSADPANHAFSLSQCEGSMPHLRVTKDGNVVVDDSFKLKALANATTSNNVTHVDVSALSIDSVLLKLAKTDQPFTVDIQDGKPSGGGTIKLVVNGPKLNQAVRAFSPKAPAVSSALFDGTLAFAGGGEKDSSVKFDGGIKSLTIDQTPIKNETVKINLDSVIPSSMDRATVNAAVKAAYLSLTAKDVKVQKPAPGEAMTAAVPSASVNVNVSDLARAQAIASAFGAPLPVNTVGSFNLDAAVKSGSVTVDFKGEHIALRNDKGQNFSFAENKPLTLSLAADIKGKTAIEEIDVRKLAGDLDVVTVAMPQPITVTGLNTSTPVPSGQIELAGAIERIAPLLQVIQQADAPLPYKGLFKLRQTVATKGDEIALKGDGTVDNFEALDTEGKTQFTEKQITIANDLAANPKTHHAAINNLAVEMTASQAAKVTVNGSIANWDTTRTFEGSGLIAKIKYDAAKLWPIIYAKMSPEQQKNYADAKVVGAFEKTFTVTGSYPAAKTMGESIRPLKANGSFELTQFTAGGIDLHDLLLNLAVAKGVATVTQQPAKLNNGTLSLNNVQVDLTQTDLRLFTPRNLQLVSKASINPALGETLGKYINPTFANAKQAKGLLSVTVNECKSVALSPATLQTEKSGSAIITINIEDMDIANPLGSLMLGPILDAIGKGSSSDIDTFQGELKNGKITLEKGVVTNDMVFTLSKPVQVTDPRTGKTATVPKGMPLGFAGGIRLKDLQMDNMIASIPAGLIASVAGTQEKKITDIVGDSIKLPLKGAVTSPKPDFGGLLGKIAENALKSKLTGEGDGKSPLDNLLKGSDKKKKKKDGE